MEINYLRYFYEVAKAGSYTAAAKKLHISQSALSKSVALLEHQEQIKLFERTKNGVILTKTGQQIYKKCESIFQSIEELEKQLHNKDQLMAGPLHFGSSDHLAYYIIPHAIKKMYKEYNKILPRLFVASPVQLIEALLKREIEMAFLFTSIPNTHIEYKSLGTMEFLLVGTTEVLNSYKGQKIKQILNEVPFIGSRHQDYAIYPSLPVFEDKSEFNDIAFESNSQQVQKKLCLQGLGLALLARFMIQKELNSRQLVQLSTTKPIFNTLFLATRKNHTLSDAALKIIEFVKQSESLLLEK